MKGAKDFTEGQGVMISLEYYIKNNGIFAIPPFGKVLDVNNRIVTILDPYGRTWNIDKVYLENDTILDPEVYNNDNFNTKVVKNLVQKFIAEEDVRAIDDVPTGSTKVIAYSIHINLRVFQFEVVEKDTIEVVVVVLTSVSKNDIEILAAFIDDCGKADDLGTGADDDDQLQLAVVLPLDITIIEFGLLDIHITLILLVFFLYSFGTTGSE